MKDKILAIGITLALCGAGFVVFWRADELDKSRLQHSLKQARERAETLEKVVYDLTEEVRSLKAHASELEEENTRLRATPTPDATATPTTTAVVSATPSPGPSPTPRPKRVRGNGEKIVLTFDDGGTRSEVAAILGILQKKDVRAVMFLVGQWAQAHPDLVRRMREAGHVVANHTWSHARLTELPDKEVREEVRRGAQEGSDLFRPPYGAIDARIRGIVSGMGYRVMLWDIDTRDWDATPADEIVRITLDYARPGAVVLLHFHGEYTAEALPNVIDEVRDLGYTFGV